MPRDKTTELKNSKRCTKWTWFKLRYCPRTFTAKVWIKKIPHLWRKFLCAAGCIIYMRQRHDKHFNGRKPLILKKKRAGYSETLSAICRITWGRIPDGTNPQLSFTQDIRLYGEIRYPAKMRPNFAHKLNIPSVGGRDLDHAAPFPMTPPLPLTHSLKHIHRIHPSHLQ
jgi:hypothetical protein